ncbi:MAG TPA: hypothetical protein VFO54_04430 [Chryseosolibacter sp.]|nr:hypothetical protein [Chryseosolibacter sp.]
MNRQPDKLFRDKLHGYQKPVSSELWKRIPTTSAGKAYPMLWLKIAAGLLLLAAASVLLFPVPRKAEPLTAQKSEPATTLSPTNQEKELSEQSVRSETEKQAPSPSTTDRDKKTPQRRGVEKEIVIARPNVKQESSPQAAETERALSRRDDIIETNIIPAPEESLAAGPESESGNVTIVLTLNEVNEKYLKKKNTIAEATSDGKETSGLRKLLDKASDLTYNQDPLGSLRQKKNEILALNLRGGKERNENHEKYEFETRCGDPLNTDLTTCFFSGKSF